VDEGIDLVVVFSGDGTINEAVNALAGTETALGVLPGGATNILVRALGLPLDPVEATGVLIAKALDDHAFKLSLGVADGRYFAVNCGAGVDAAVERVRARVGDSPVYVSIDIDVLDPAHAPGTGTPEPGGLTTREAQLILRGLAGLPLVGADVVEVAPPYDHAELTSLAAANLAYELLTLFALAPH